MKKDRNTFFSEYGFNQTTNMMPTMPNQNMMPNASMMPNQTFAANSSLYAGPAVNMNQNMYSDIDARLAKIERELNRLENRISRLEGDYKSQPDDMNYSNSLYMV